MNKPEHFEVLEDHAVFRPTGEVSLEQAVQLITSAIAYACEEHIKKLLVNTTGLSGFGPPYLADRYFHARDWANAAQGSVCVAVVARPEMFDFEKIGGVIAENAGLRVIGFESEDEALAWLRRVEWVAEGGKIQFTRR